MFQRKKLFTEFLILFFLSSCAPNIGDYYQESFNRVKTSSLKKVVYKKFISKLDDYYINQAYFDIEGKIANLDLAILGEATIVTNIYQRNISREQLEIFAKKIGAKVAVGYIFPGKKSVEHFSTSMSSWDDYDEFYTVNKLIFYADKEKGNQLNIYND